MKDWLKERNNERRIKERISLIRNKWKIKKGLKKERRIEEMNDGVNKKIEW